MKAVILKKFGSVENLEPAELPDPEPKAGEVLLKVRACALNHLDIWVRNGIPAYKIALPHILGCDVAGEISAVGPGVSEKRIGERAAVAPGRSCLKCQFCAAGLDNRCSRYGIIGAGGGPGGYAELLAVPENYLLPITDSLSFESAAAFPLTFLTAWHMVSTLGEAGPGKTVLVIGAGSGVGVAAIQVAKLHGCRVIASSTSQVKLDKAKDLGADDLILSPPKDLVRSTMRATGGAMVDTVIEHVGPAVFDAALKCLKTGGRLVTCGATSGPTVTIDLRYVFSRQLQILGSKMGTLAETRIAAGMVAAGRLKPVVDRCFPLAEAAKAHEYLSSRKQFGKVVLLT